MGLHGACCVGQARHPRMVIVWGLRSRHSSALSFVHCQTDVTLRQQMRFAPFETPEPRVAPCEAPFEAPVLCQPPTDPSFTLTA